MTDLMKADVFFFVATIAIVILTILLVIGLIYVIIVLRDTKKFVSMVKEEGEEMIDDLKEFRIKLKQEGNFLRKVPLIFGLINKFKSRKKDK